MASSVYILYSAPSAVGPFVEILGAGESGSFCWLFCSAFLAQKLHRHRKEEQKHSGGGGDGRKPVSVNLATLELTCVNKRSSLLSGSLE